MRETTTEPVQDALIDAPEVDEGHLLAAAWEVRVEVIFEDGSTGYAAYCTGDIVAEARTDEHRDVAKGALEFALEALERDAGVPLETRGSLA